MISRKKGNDIFRYLDNDDLLMIIGARQVGKTTLLKEISEYLLNKKEEVYELTLEDPELRSDLNKHPQNIFKYCSKRQYRIYLLIDEIQYLNNPSNFLKYLYDLYRGKLKVVVTGSSAFYIDKKFKDSLAGRKRVIEIFPFCFSEFLEARSEPELSRLVAGKNEYAKKRKWLIPEKRKLSQYLYEYTIYGGYPKIVLENNLKEKKLLLKELVLSFLKKDVHEAGIKDEEKFYRLVRLLAAQTGRLVNSNELAGTLEVSKDTVSKYLYILQKSYIIRLIPPFYKNIRKELTKMPKVFFVDNGYRNFLINLFEDINSRPDSGAALENIFFSEMVKFDIEDIKFWRTQDKKEVDFVLNGSMAFEVRSSIKSFRNKKYMMFQNSYPNIAFHPLTFLDDNELDVLDFTG